MSRKPATLTRLPRLVRQLKVQRKAASALPVSPLAISHIPYAYYPLRPKYRGSVAEPDTGSLASTRSSSASWKVPHKDPTEALPQCSAAAWAVSNGKTGECLGGRGETGQREVASLTKIMTCVLSVQLLKYFEEVSLDTLVTVSEKAARMNGTSAGLEAGDRLSVRDLLHALMLPSGNDAAQCLSEFFGYYLALRAGADPTIRLDRHFVREMNDLAGALELTQTFYRNPHGMSTNVNISTARDVNALATFALKSQTIRSVVSCQRYTCHIYTAEDSERIVTWENTNKLLSKGFDGVKTGVTDAAGPCLCTSLSSGRKRVIVTILGARSMEERWTDAQRLVRWGFDRLKTAKET